MRFTPGEPIVEAHEGGSHVEICGRTRSCRFDPRHSHGVGRSWESCVQPRIRGVANRLARDEKFAFGFRDEGMFTALAPMCEKGYATDLEHVLTDGWVTALRRFDCGDGESIVARTWRTAGDPSWGYEEGAWLIVAGSGAYRGATWEGHICPCVSRRRARVDRRGVAWRRRLRCRASRRSRLPSVDHGTAVAPHGALRRSPDVQRSRCLGRAGSVPGYGEEQRPAGGEVRHRRLRGDVVRRAERASTCR